MENFAGVAAALVVCAIGYVVARRGNRRGRAEGMKPARRDAWIALVLCAVMLPGWSIVYWVARYVGHIYRRDHPDEVINVTPGPQDDYLGYLAP